MLKHVIDTNGMKAIVHVFYWCQSQLHMFPENHNYTWSIATFHFQEAMNFVSTIVSYSNIIVVAHLISTSLLLKEILVTKKSIYQNFLS